jgi:hypothetical protein
MSYKSTNSFTFKEFNEMYPVGITERYHTLDEFEEAMRKSFRILCFSLSHLDYNRAIEESEKEKKILRRFIVYFRGNPVYIVWDISGFQV